MKKKFFIVLILSTIFVVNVVHSEVIFEEIFDYNANRPLILDPVKNSDNFDGITGWSTQSSSKSAINCFDIVENPLVYEGYELSGVGRAVKYKGDDGQGVFKLFDQPIRTEATLYIAFLINIPNKTISGGDYMVGIKMEPSATSTNWGGRLYASVDPGYPQEEVTFKINKASTGTPSYPKDVYFAANKTHLIVLKYKLGVLNGKSAAEEAGKYDDEISLYVNPPLNGVEPETPVVKQADPTQKDIYRYGESGVVLGGARGIYFRPSPEGNNPAYTISGIRVGMKWEDVIPNPTTINGIKAEGLSCFVRDKQIVINSSENTFSTYEILSPLGQKVMSGFLNANQINASNLKAGVYILHLKGTQKASMKIVIQ